MSKEFFYNMREQMAPSEKAVNQLYAKIEATESNADTNKQHTKTKSLKPWIKYVAAAACVALIAVTAVNTNFYNFNNGIIDTPSNEKNPSNVTSGVQGGITIPTMKLPNTNNTVMDMIGFIVYNGKIYTQAEYLRCDEATRKAFTGEYLGKASGTIDEWSSKIEYNKEFASSVTGDVYTVNGYDKDFRICIPQMYDGREFIAFFENLNGITLATGNDLFGDRLHLKDNYIDVTYQLHNDWNNNKGNFKKFSGLTNADLKKFLDALYQSPIIDLTDKTNLYNSDIQQSHIFFKIKDGTTVVLRLFENGYVGYSGMIDRVFVNMSDDIFKKIFEASIQ